MSEINKAPIREMGIDLDLQFKEDLDTNFENLANKDVEIISRVNNIIAAGGESNVEIVDARHSDIKNKTYSVLTDRIESIETDVNAIVHVDLEVTDETERYALTTDEVALNNIVKQLDTSVLYIVTDTANLNNENGYTIYNITSEIAANTVARHTHSNTTALNAVSGTNTGDETLTTLGTKLNEAVGASSISDTIAFPNLNETALRKTTWANIKSALKTYFDTLYNKYVLPVASTTLGGVKSGTDITVDNEGNVSVNNTDTVDGKHASDFVQKTEKITLPVSTTDTAYLNIPSGSSPSSPVNGDIWQETYNLYIRLNGSTRRLLNSGNAPNASASIISQSVAEEGTSTGVYYWTPQRVAQAIAAQAAAKEHTHTDLPNALGIKGTGTGTANTSYLAFNESNGSLQGFAGFYSNSDNTLQLYNSVAGGELRLTTTAGGAVTVNGSEILYRYNIGNSAIPLFNETRIKATSDNLSNSYGILAFYNNSQSTRWAYIGKAYVGGGAFHITNEVTNADISLNTIGTGKVRANGNEIVTKVAVPASATATGTAGQVAYDNGYFYVCVATNTWCRYAKSAW